MEPQPAEIKLPLLYKMKRLAGFTLIETLVVIIISGILFSGGIAAYKGIGARQDLKQAGITFQSNLRSFQQKALSSEKPSGCEGTLERYRVRYIDSIRYSVKAECSTNNGPETEFKLTEGVEFTDVFSDIVFITLKAEIYGAQTIKFKSGSGGSSLEYEVIIQPSGVITGKMNET